jgi:TonB-dependent receptor-like protein
MVPRVGSAAVLLTLLVGPASAQVQVLPRVDVVATPLPPMLGAAASASEGDVPREQIEARPVFRPGEILEEVPSLIVTQHSGEGKANQYFLRGFNLDHGTDLAITVNAGAGYHSNDVRGATIAFDPNDRVTPVSKVPLLVRSKGAEIGARRATADLEASLALFVLDFDSELVFSGDAGTTEASRPSRRIGAELATLWRPFQWLVLDVDAAVTRARFTDDDPAGDRIPGAPNAVASVGAAFDKLGAWFGGVQLRYFGRRPLVEDDSVTSKPTTLVSARLGYR